LIGDAQHPFCGGIKNPSDLWKKRTQLHPRIFGHFTHMGSKAQCPFSSTLSRGRRCGRWLPVKNDYLFNEEALSQVFRGKFKERLKRVRKPGAIKFAGRAYGDFKNVLYAKNWVVSVRELVKRPKHVLGYIERHIHRVAIANSCIKKLEIGIQYPYSSIIPDRREAASYIFVLSIIPPR
jgi:hypothetical protein